MKRTIIAAALALTMTSGAAYACDDLTYIKVSNLADQLGSILGSKKACGIEYDEDGVQSFIIKTVEGPMHQCIDESENTFASWVNMNTAIAKENIEKLPKSLLAAHCIQIRRVAKQYGFTK